MSNSQAKKDFPDNKQRVAVCNSRWRKAKKSKAELTECEKAALDELMNG